MKGKEEQLRLIYPNLWGVVNVKKRIRSDKDVHMLLQEITNTTFEQRLIESHVYGYNLIVEFYYEIRQLYLP